MTRFSKIGINTTSADNAFLMNAGLIPLVELYDAMGLPSVINEKLHVRKDKGFSDSTQILSLALMQLAGGETIDDLAHFKDSFSVPGNPVEIPSPGAARAYLNCFHNEEDDSRRGYGNAFVPKANEHLYGFSEVHYHIMRELQKLRPIESVTLDQDATFIETGVEGALRNYKGESSFEALNIYSPEYDMIVATQFRDGNVPPGFGQLEQLKDVLEHLPDGVKKVYFRSDAAGYQVDLMKYCAVSDETRRFPVIDFTISCPVTKEFREAARSVPESEWSRIYKLLPDGTRLYTDQECADVPYFPNSLNHSRGEPEYRFIAIREICNLPAHQAGKIRADDLQRELDLEIAEAERENENMKKLHLSAMADHIYKVFGLVTNLIEHDNRDLVLSHHERCGKSEEAHLVLKEELAGGHVISKRFGASAAYWNVAVMTMSLNNILKRHFLPTEFRNARPKKLRYRFYGMAGRFARHARCVILKIFGCKGGAGLFVDAMKRIRLCFNLS